MTLITDLEKFKELALKEKCKIMEVTIKKLYITYPGEELTEEDIKAEWFGTHLNRPHAYKDASHVGGADKLVDIKFFSADDKEEVQS